MKIRSAFILIGLLIVCVSGLNAQVPVRLASEAEGFSFSPPKGWTRQTTTEGFAFTDAGKTMLLIVKGHNYRDAAAFAADANLERDGLELVGTPQEIAGGFTFRAVKRSAAGTAVIDTSVLFSPHGGGVVVVAMSEEAKAAAGFDAGLAAAESVRFVQPKASAGAEKVRSMLSGKLLTYLYTGSGYSERKDILLCSSGAFYQTTDMGGFATGDVDGPSFAATGGKSGRWSISTDGRRLVLQFNNGGTGEFILSARAASNEIGMNGKRFFVQSQNRCR